VDVGGAEIVEVGAACVAVGMARVGEGIATVAVGLTCGVGEATAVRVSVGSAAVFVGTEVCSGWMLTSNCPQAARANATINGRSLFTFMGPLF
jgi:hypothetical protein